MPRNIKWSKLSKLTVDVHVWPKSMDHYQLMDVYSTSYNRMNRMMEL